jgi:CheY-like chemotaxis protein
MVEKAPPDLVIAEVELGNMSGLELAGVMRHHPGLFHIPSLLMGLPYLKDDALAAGCDAFVAKPFYVEKLLQILTHLVPGNLPC